MMLAVLGWSFFVMLPPRLSRAAHELAAGQTTSMDAVLWVFCLLWLFVLVEDANVSLTSRHLLTFPIDVGSLLGVRILSLFCSPGDAADRAWLPDQPLAVFLCAPPCARRRRRAAALCAGTRPGNERVARAERGGIEKEAARAGGHRQHRAGRVLLCQGAAGSSSRCGSAWPSRRRIWSLPRPSPPLRQRRSSHSSTLLAISAPVWHLLLWSFRRSLFSQTVQRRGGTRARQRALVSWPIRRSGAQGTALFPQAARPLAGPAAGVGHQRRVAVRFTAANRPPVGHSHRVRAERQCDHELFRPGHGRRAEPLLHPSAPWQGRAARQEPRADGDRRGAAGVADPDRCLAIRPGGGRGGNHRSCGRCCFRIWPGATWCRSLRHSRCSSIASLRAVRH